MLAAAFETVAFEPKHGSKTFFYPPMTVQDAFGKFSKLLALATRIQDTLQGIGM